MPRLVPAIVLLVLPAVPLGAQAPDASHAAVTAVKGQWESVTNYILQSARDMPEAKFSFRPVPEVRTFGEILGHVSGSQDMFCAIVLGEKAPAEDAVEKAAKTKAALIESLTATTAHCAKAYAMSDAEAQAPAQVFGQPNTRLGVLVLNAVHNAEHYGNLVTYLRINGMVPPSSRRGP